MRAAVLIIRCHADAYAQPVEIDFRLAQSVQMRSLTVPAIAGSVWMVTQKEFMKHATNPNRVLPGF